MGKKFFWNVFIKYGRNWNFGIGIKCNHLHTHNLYSVELNDKVTKYVTAKIPVLSLLNM
jgi:hypothetical protein